LKADPADWVWAWNRGLFFSLFSFQEEKEKKEINRKTEEEEGT